MSDAQIPEVLGGLVVRPGDTLIVRVQQGMYREQFDRAADLISEMMEKRCPGVKVAVIAAEQLAVYRPGGDTDG